MFVLKSAEGVNPIWPHQDLHGEQAFSSIAGINSELNRQTRGDAFCVQAGAAGAHFAGVVPGLRHYLEWTEQGSEMSSVITKHAATKERSGSRKFDETCSLESSEAVGGDLNQDISRCHGSCSFPLLYLCGTSCSAYLTATV